MLVAPAAEVELVAARPPVALALRSRFPYQERFRQNTTSSQNAKQPHAPNDLECEPCHSRERNYAEDVAAGEQRHGDDQQHRAQDRPDPGPQIVKDELRA